MTDAWDSRVEQLWPGARDDRLDELLAEMLALAAERLDAGRPDAALAVALNALAQTLPLYGRVVAEYAAGLSSRDMKKL